MIGFNVGSISVLIYFCGNKLNSIDLKGQFGINKGTRFFCKNIYDIGIFKIFFAILKI